MNTATMIAATALSTTLVGSLALSGCVPARPAPCPSLSEATAAKPPDSPPHVYRLEFSVTSGEANATPLREQFILNLAERQHGDVAVGRNVALQPAGTGGGGSPRADVGLRLGADCAASGEDVLVQVRLEATDAEAAPAGGPVPIHKATGSSDVLVRPGQPALALRMDDGHRQYEVNVTATRLR